VVAAAAQRGHLQPGPGGGVRRFGGRVSEGGDGGGISNEDFWNNCLLSVCDSERIRSKRLLPC
jgi:hypothetical protein